MEDGCHPCGWVAPFRVVAIDAEVHHNMVIENRGGGIDTDVQLRHWVHVLDGLV